MPMHGINISAGIQQNLYHLGGFFIHVARCSGLIPSSLLVGSIYIYTFFDQRFQYL